ncbi:hypothetical protein EST38_g10564 [Candolleomyces aberdarensis]|uniref:DUF427 domain-containing protein n=1 Tax=Candolleomyces aberdarensis TaxID=2316362 RepID=A0A4Q2D9A2_9AGAR|nr:hypothetical protein EST38_g10564 [Candolleomyces aberdarensis]
MVKVTLGNTVLAESSDTIVVEGNHYFPPSSINKSAFTDSETQYVLFLSAASPTVQAGFFNVVDDHSTTCGWKGVASYYNVNTTTDDGSTSSQSDVAWYYPNTKEAAKNIEGYVAFYKNKVTISDA